MKHLFLAIALLTATIVCFSQSRSNGAPQPLTSMIQKGTDTVKWTMHWADLVKLHDLLNEAIITLRNSGDLTVYYANILGNFADSLKHVIETKGDLWMPKPVSKADTTKPKPN